jgi:transposase InsO family protein
MNMAFENFVLGWGITHRTSSPRYPQSNGFVEVMVKHMKSMIRKSMLDYVD